MFYEDELYSEEHRRKFTTERAGFQVVKDPSDKSKLGVVSNANGEDSKFVFLVCPKPLAIFLLFYEIISHTGFRQVFFSISSGRNAFFFRKHPDKVGNIAKSDKIANL